MKTAITIQDEYIAKVSQYDPTGATYATLVTKASKAARYALIDDLGLTDAQARRMVSDAHEVATFQWTLRECPCLLDPLNHSV